jgi:hypothetical protein
VSGYLRVKDIHRHIGNLLRKIILRSASYIIFGKAKRFLLKMHLVPFFFR